jgi:hypothetical protein
MRAPSTGGPLHPVSSELFTGLLALESQNVVFG